jgi:hypothetical protein
MCPSCSAATQKVVFGHEIPTTAEPVVITRRHPGFHVAGFVDWNTSIGRPGPAPVSAAKHNPLDGHQIPSIVWPSLRVTDRRTTPSRHTKT